MYSAVYSAVYSDVHSTESTDRCGHYDQCGPVCEGTSCLHPGADVITDGETRDIALVTSYRDH